MAFITLAGTLRDPTSELAVGDQIRFTHKSTTGETIEGAVSVLTIDPSGTYSKDLQYGLVLVEYKDVRTSQFKNLGVATVNGSNPATSIPELLNALVPVSSAELIEFQAILADAVTARNEAEAFAASIDLINDLSQAYIFDTVALYKASTIAFPTGKAIHLNDRGADFMVISGTASNNNENVISSDQVSSSIELKDDIVLVVGDGDTYNSTKLPSATNTRVIFTSNCMQEPTLNGKALKILDVYQTEQQQWTIVNGGDASKDIPKVDIFRSVSRGMISEDIPYTLQYNVTGDFYVIAITRLYKHVFLKCGNGAEITELQDAFGYLSQFDKGSHMDTTFMRSDLSTDFFPNKAQISVILPAGPDENTPIVSNMSKPIRIGENDLNGIEIINDTRYFTNLKYGACVVNFTGTLGSDDLAVLNIWKTNLGEVKGITWRYHGEFNYKNQAVVRYNRSEARFKDCAIDVENATFVGSPAAVVGIYFDRQVETFGCKFIGPASSQSITAVSMYSTLFGGWEITGRPESAFAIRGQCLLTSDIVISGIVQNVFVPFGDSSVYVAGAGSTLNGVNLYKAGSIPFTIHIDSNVTVVPSPWQYYKGKTVQTNTTLWVEDAATPQITANSTSGGPASFAIAQDGIIKAKAGNVASITGYEISGDGTTRHLKVEPTGGARLYSGDGATNGILTVIGSNLFWNGTQLN